MTRGFENADAPQGRGYNIHGTAVSHFRSHSDRPTSKGLRKTLKLTFIRTGLAHALEVVLQPNRSKLHHSIHEAAQVELVAFGGPDGVVNLRDFRIAKVISRDL